MGWEYEAATWLTTDLSQDPFWDLPRNLSRAKPGDILRWQDLDGIVTGTNWTIPGGTALSRFQYASEDADGTVVAASAFLLLPFALPHGAKNLRTLVWTHGTAGVAPICAPTNNKNLYYDWQSVYTLVQSGYAVIAPDYAGLGSTTPNGFEYMAAFTHAADVAFSVIAARNRIGKLLTKEWVVIGQSEGGWSAWQVNLRFAREYQERLLKAGKFLGSVAIAPATRVIDILKTLKDVPAGPDGGINDIVSYLLPVISRLYPNLRLEDYLTQTAIGRFRDLTSKSCVYGGFYAFAYLTEEEMYKNSSWTEHPAISEWRKTYSGEGYDKLSAPMLIVHGTEDGLVPFDHVVEDFNRTCEAYPDSSLTFLSYEGLAHDSVTVGAQADYLRWLDDLFSGKKQRKGCSRTDIRPITGRFQPVAFTYNALI